MAYVSWSWNIGEHPVLTSLHFLPYIIWCIPICMMLCGLFRVCRSALFSFQNPSPGPGRGQATPRRCGSGFTPTLEWHELVISVHINNQQHKYDFRIDALMIFGKGNLAKIIKMVPGTSFAPFACLGKLDCKIYSTWQSMPVPVLNELRKKDISQLCTGLLSLCNN